MRRNLLTVLAAASSLLFFACKQSVKPAGTKPDQIIYARVGDEEKDEDADGYDGAAERDQFEFERMKDPKLGYVPAERMITAVDYTETQKAKLRSMRIQSALTWSERGPIYDLVGASGNSRGSGTPYTSGRTSAILVDTLNDATGNTVFCGGIAGGLWKCTNFLSATPNWVAINDRFDNLAITSITQNPANKNEMYFSTGEATSNGDAVYGGGVWKSTDAGATWTRLLSSTGLQRIFKIVCDASGDVFVANRNSGLSTSQVSGLYRSVDGGGTWVNITPSPIGSSNNICTDVEISTTGKLHASFGYNTGGTTNKIQHVFTTIPGTVTPSSGWNVSTGIRNSGLYALRLELATQGDILYGVTTNSGSNVDSCYKSIDGGATWTKQNTTALATGILNGQGWYNLTLAINPSNSAEVLIGGLDLYKSSNNGTTFPTKMTSWIGDPYVHADHHFMQWWNISGQSRIVIGCDGGVFLSNDGGTSFSDRNRNLAIKQFYGADIHPTAGSNYMIAGAQDNGVHQFTQPGKSYSTEVYGGDGFLVHINQANPQIQFGTYVYNTYRRSTDGGNTWSSFAFGATSGANPNGLFVNPYDYDDGKNILYACFGTPTTPNQILRWADANTSSAASSFTITALAGDHPSVFKVSPFTKDRVYIGGENGKLVRLDNASTVTSANINANVTTLTGSAFPTANLSCINTGTDDNNLVAVFSNYGVAHVFVSADGGTNWANVTGNLPDMPVRWAIFDPQNNSKLYLATEAGVYYTDAVNGGSTSWTSDPNFPTVRTDMLRVRLSDNTVVAATHGRGLYTAQIPATPELRFNATSISLLEATTGTINCRRYTDYTIPVTPVASPTGDAIVTYSINAGNTAVEGVDFDFTTNGNFGAPSKSHTFTSGSTSSQNITVRIYDDTEVSTDKTFTITFSVTGSTDAFAGAYSTCSVIVKNNDLPPAVPVTATYTVGSSVYYLGSTASGSPFDAKLQGKRSQMLYTAAELTAAGLSRGNINSVAFFISKSSTRAYQSLQIKMGSTTTALLFDGTNVNEVPTTLVKNAFNFTPSAGQVWNTITLDNPFFWDGVSNLVVETCYSNSTADASNLADRTIGYSDGSGANQGNIIWQDNLACGSAFTNVTYFSNGIKPQLMFNSTSTGVYAATNLNSSATEYFTSNKDLYFYSQTNDLVAKVTNLSGFNYGCTQAVIDRAGTGAQAFWNNNPSNYIMNKTFRILPGTNNASGQYQVTLFFTAAEKAGWEAATGNSWNNIQLIKTQGPISDVTPGNPNGAGAMEVVTPTRGTLGANYTLTYTFNSGFSGFGAGIPGIALPVVLLNFDGKLNNNTALLNWSTSSEQNSKNFEVEKSTDGANFYKIGSVNAAGSSSSRKDYSFRDQQLNPMNYYRLRMNDNDGHFKLSDVVLVNYSSSVQKVSVVNNPFTTFLDVRFAKQGASATLQLINSNGAIIAQKQVANPSGQMHWALPVNVSAGSYILRTVVDGTVFTHKLIKQ